MEKSYTIFLSLLFFLFSLIVPSVEITKTNIKTDEAALLALKSSIVSDPFQMLAKNWSSGTSVCSWIGLTCGARHRRVVELDISNMGLTGQLPPMISNLTFLVSLNIANNSFNGDLSESFANLRRLRFLNLYLNNFGGRIPSSIGRLPKLEILLLRNNSFSGFIPPAIFNISTLEGIDLSFNDISGNLPPHMCHHLPRLRGLHLSYNRITGEIPSSLSSCSALQIVSLSLNNFYGSVPQDIGNLNKLQRLYLGYNRLTGVLPLNLGNLDNLVVLSIGYNLISGHVPATMFNMSSLESLLLANNSISGSLPLDMCDHNQLSFGTNYLEGHMPKVRHGCKSILVIDLSSNRLSGSIPKGIGNLTSLKELYLSYNEFTGRIPEEVGKLDQLEIINIEANSLHGAIPIGLFNISSLYSLSLSSNHLSGRLPSNVGSMLPNLKSFLIAKNLLEGSIPGSISNSSQLKQLDLTSNKFSGPVPNSIGNLRVLEWLNLAYNNLTKDSLAPELRFIDSLTNCINLRTLDIRGNQFNATLPQSIGNLSIGLIYLAIGNAKLKGSIPVEIGNLQNLQYLDFGGNDLTGHIPTTIGGLKELQILYLDENKLEGPFPSVLCELNNLGMLIMRKNKISGSIPKCIENVPSLRIIYLDTNELSSNIPESLWNLKDVLQLDLSYNSFTGSLGSEISSLRAITDLDLSNNQLSGNFPKGVSDLLTLTFLDLSHNGINGSIPDIFANLAGLEQLDLSSNDLSGTLPRSIEKLKLLKFFNVSYNQLAGQIPVGGQFHNFTYASFMSNKGFCGAPWLHFPPCFRENKSGKKRSLMYVFISLAFVVFFVPIVILVLWKFQARRVRNRADPSLEADTTRISYLELRRATSEFSEENLIGTGGFGSVYKATLSNGEFYAVKVFHSQQEGAFMSFERECEVLRNIRHRNIAKVISSCSNLDFKSLILQYMPNGSLESWLYSNELFLDFLQRLDLMIDVGCALEYLHHGYTTPIIHCDLKPSNVLIDSDMVGHVSDFGISRLLGDDESFLHTITLATFGYMAPEYGTDGLVSTKCDVYSFGIMLLEVFTRKKPSDDMFNEGSSLRSWVSDATSDSLFGVIDTTILQPDEEFSNKKLQASYFIIQLGLNCSSESQERRPSMVEALASLRKIKHELI